MASDIKAMAPARDERPSSANAAIIMRSAGGAGWGAGTLGLDELISEFSCAFILTIRHRMCKAVRNPIPCEPPHALDLANHRDRRHRSGRRISVRVRHRRH